MPCARASSAVSCPAGTRIDQDALAAEFSVSRMPVREALRQLGAEGFVTIVPHRGAIVTALSPAEVEEIYEIRAALEGVAARHASQTLTADDLERLRRSSPRCETRSRSTPGWG